MAKAAPLIASDPEGTFARNAGLMLHIRLGEMYSLADAVPDSSRIQDLHNMRIAAKRLRYTLEIFEPCFAGSQLVREYKFLYGSVKSIQEQIGDIHDCDFRMPALEAFLQEHGKRRPEIKIGLERLIEHEQARRASLHALFVTYWSKLEKKGFRPRFELAIFGLSQPLDQAPESVEQTDDGND